MMMRHTLEWPRGLTEPVSEHRLNSNQYGLDDVYQGYLTCQQQ
jgi:hypothetical protein